MTDPLVTVLILAYNKREEVAVNLAKLRDELDYPADRLEVIVVDNASADGTAEMVAERHPEVKLIRNEKNTGAPALNLGFAAGRGEWFVVLDDDCYIEGRALRDALDAARAQDADLVSFAVISGEDPSYRFDVDYKPGLLGFWGCAFVISGRAIARLKGYDPAVFIWGNEPELTLRLLDAGFRHLYLPSVVAVHMKAPPPDTQATVNRTWNLQHFTHLAAKHFPARHAVPALAFLASRALLGSVPRREVKVSLRSFAAGLRSGLRARHPARPEVTKLYRYGFPEFVSPTHFTRPGNREAGFAELRREFWAKRPALYPDGEASLKV